MGVRSQPAPASTPPAPLAHWPCEPQTASGSAGTNGVKKLHDSTVRLCDRDNGPNQFTERDCNISRRDDMTRKTNSVLVAASLAGLALGVLTFCPLPLQAQAKVLQYELDPSWPKPLPNLWVTGGVGGVCVDSQDHVLILNRSDVTDNELDSGHRAPPVIELDPEGNVVNSFGDPE